MTLLPPSHSHPGSSTSSYIVISPVRNEAAHLEETIASMLRQTVHPVLWILVNDGSEDRTGEIIDCWASKVPWIMPIHRLDQRRRNAPNTARPAETAPEKQPERSMRAREAKEILAFYDGYDRLKNVDWEYIVKLDGDLGFEPDYFEQCLAEFARDPQLGVGGGRVSNLVNGTLEDEPNPRFHVRGATKIYRRACWEDIGGVPRGAGWDTIDEVKANMMGWSTRTFADRQVIHYKPTGAANGAWQNAIKNGLWNYIVGYHPLFMIVKCLKNLFTQPYLIRASGLMYGFFLGAVQKTPQIDDRALIRYLRGQQMRRLCFRPTIWK